MYLYLYVCDPVENISVTIGDVLDTHYQSDSRIGETNSICNTTLSYEQVMAFKEDITQIKLTKIKNFLYIFLSQIREHPREDNSKEY